MVNETALLQKYDKDIRIIVNRYLFSVQFSTNCSFYEDLINEAFLAFLITCRSFDLDGLELTDLQRTMCKNKIESTLRVYIWKMYNMGGYNNHKIDLSRSVTISDVLGDTDLDIDDVIPNTYQEDFTFSIVEDFLSILSDREKSALKLILSGYTLSDIGNVWNRNEKVVRRKIKSIQAKYNDFAASAA